MEQSLPTDVQAWRARGQYSLHRGLEVFSLVHGKPHHPPLLVLHGFPTSSYDFHRTLETLGAERQVFLVDLPGYGLSDKPPWFSYSLVAQVTVLIERIRAWGLTHFHLLAHDMGTSVAAELLARQLRDDLPFRIASLVLTNGSVYQDMASITLSQHILRAPVLGPLFVRLANERSFQLQIRRVLHQKHHVDRAEFHAHWALLAHRQGTLRLPKLAGYMAERHTYAHRWHGALRAFPGPSLVLWGRRDPVALPAIAQRLSQELQNNRLHWLDEVGHYPMLEAPEAFSRAVLDFLQTTSREPR